MTTKATLKQRILLGYLVPLLLLLGVATITYYHVQTVRSVSADLERENGIVRDVNKYHMETERIMRGVRAYLLTGDKRALAMFQEAVTARRAVFDSLSSGVLDLQQRDSLREIAELGEQVLESSKKYVDLVSAGQTDQAQTAFRSGDEVGLVTRMEEVFKRFEGREGLILVASGAEVRSAMSRLVWLVVLSTLVALVAAIVVGNVTAGRISAVIGEAVIGVSSSSTEIAATVNEHERAVSQQAAAVNETTSTVEELGASSRQSAGQAEATAEAARQAIEVTQNGIALANQVSHSMTALKHKVSSVAEQILRLSEQAQQIGTIARVVGELASETNMLALNAAVEAARAGEHGKGFAVVAAEVRKLADQSKKSGERANALVAEIQKATNSAVMVTDEGSRTAEEVTVITAKTLDAFNALASTANGVSESAQQVLLNSKQQAAALSQVTEAMKSLSAGSREMAAGTVQTKAGVLKLNGVALELKAMI
jgi:CHASE3 domain sensor protein